MGFNGGSQIKGKKKKNKNSEKQVMVRECLDFA